MFLGVFGATWAARSKIRGFKVDCQDEVLETEHPNFRERRNLFSGMFNPTPAVYGGPRGAAAGGQKIFAVKLTLDACRSWFYKDI